MMNIKSTILFLVVIFGLMIPVSAHGVHVTPDSATAIIIADNSTGSIAKRTVDEMGMNVTVYSFQSDVDVNHELEHLLTNPNKKVLAVGYLDTVNKFLAQHPEVSDRIIVCNPDPETIRKGLNRLDSTPTESSYGFLTPFLTGALIGALSGIGVGAFLMKRKLS
ncbi:MAG: hypothetical protein QM405_02830 [Euryarchaeota archaeon]|jgi:hypothetical protein|nr:hypothetical protein [Euryarchaeota archaeon]